MFMRGNGRGIEQMVLVLTLIWMGLNTTVIGKAINNTVRV